MKKSTPMNNNKDFIYGFALGAATMFVTVLVILEIVW